MFLVGSTKNYLCQEIVVRISQIIYSLRMKNVAEMWKKLEKAQNLAKLSIRGSFDNFDKFL